MNRCKVRISMVMLVTIGAIASPFLGTPLRSYASEEFHATAFGTVLQPAEALTVITVDPIKQGSSTNATGDLKFVIPAGSSEYRLISASQVVRLSEHHGEMTPSSQNVTKSVRFDVDSNLPAGDYEQEVDVVADRQLVQRFVLKVTVRP